jgi:hypothetical protein
MVRPQGARWTLRSPVTHQRWVVIFFLTRLY